MNAFAAAMAALVADRHLGVDAVYRADGTGNPVAVRVLRASPDVTAGVFDAQVVQATDVLTVLMATLPNLAPGDTFTIGADLLTVKHVERSATGVAITAYCRRG